ncbi:hypothetical protein ABW19_dt0208561 [Dactylella cylindrospora]|nr:hypothetical protein ABW19_dt0208561 [Dactylella cylindrospora]
MSFIIFLWISALAARSYVISSQTGGNVNLGDAHASHGLLAAAVAEQSEFTGTWHGNHRIVKRVDTEANSGVKRPPPSREDDEDEDEYNEKVREQRRQMAWNRAGMVFETTRAAMNGRQNWVDEILWVNAPATIDIVKLEWDKTNMNIQKREVEYPREYFHFLDAIYRSDIVRYPISQLYTLMTVSQRDLANVYLTAYTSEMDGHLAVVWNEGIVQDETRFRDWIMHCWNAAPRNPEPGRKPISENLKYITIMGVKTPSSLTILTELLRHQAGGTEAGTLTIGLGDLNQPGDIEERIFKVGVKAGSTWFPLRGVPEIEAIIEVLLNFPKTLGYLRIQNIYYQVVFKEGGLDALNANILIGVGKYYEPDGPGEIQGPEEDNFPQPQERVRIQRINIFTLASQQEAAISNHPGLPDVGRTFYTPTEQPSYKPIHALHDPNEETKVIYHIWTSNVEKHIVFECFSKPEDELRQDQKNQADEKLGDVMYSAWVEQEGPTGPGSIEGITFASTDPKSRERLEEIMNWKMATGGIAVFQISDELFPRVMNSILGLREGKALNVLLKKYGGALGDPQIGAIAIGQYASKPEKVGELFMVARLEGFNGDAAVSYVRESGDGPAGGEASLSQQVRNSFLLSGSNTFAYKQLRFLGFKLKSPTAQPLHANTASRLDFEVEKYGGQNRQEAREFSIGEDLVQQADFLASGPDTESGLRLQISLESSKNYIGASVAWDQGHDGRAKIDILINRSARHLVIKNGLQIQAGTRKASVQVVAGAVHAAVQDIYGLDDDVSGQNEAFYVSILQPSREAEKLIRDIYTRYAISEGEHLATRNFRGLMTRPNRRGSWFSVSSDPIATSRFLTLLGTQDIGALVEMFARFSDQTSHWFGMMDLELIIIRWVKNKDKGLKSL